MCVKKRDPSWRSSWVIVRDREAISAYKLGDDDAADEISPATKFSLPRITSAEAIRSDLAFASGCIFHTSYAPPYLHHGLVISLEYNWPRDRHRSCCCSLVCRSESLIVAGCLSWEMSNPERGWGMSDRKIATMTEKTLTASDGHVCIQELFEV